MVDSFGKTVGSSPVLFLKLPGLCCKLPGSLASMATRQKIIAGYSLTPCLMRKKAGAKAVDAADTPAKDVMVSRVTLWKYSI